MKLFIYPPPRAGPVQACPSPFDTPHLNISCKTAQYPMHGTSHFNHLQKMTGLSFRRNLASSISFTNQPIAAWYGRDKGLRPESLIPLMSQVKRKFHARSETVLNTLVALTSHHTVNRLTLYIWLDAESYVPTN